MNDIRQFPTALSVKKKGKKEEKAEGNTWKE